MKDRFTHRSRMGRRRIPKHIRDEVFRRDAYTCQFCSAVLREGELTIDHLIPLSRGGLDEMTNYVTCCRPCNELKANLPLEQFAESIKIEVEELPVHGDPILDNDALPIQFRLLRKRIFDRVRAGELSMTGRQAQSKMEKTFRREFWGTAEGEDLIAEYPNLPGHVRIMLPEIQAIAKSEREYLLLIELAKSANTRNLIGSILDADCDVETRLIGLQEKTNDGALRKRIAQARSRFEAEARRHGL